MDRAQCSVVGLNWATIFNLRSSSRGRGQHRSLLSYWTVPAAESAPLLKLPAAYERPGYRRSWTRFEGAMWRAHCTLIFAGGIQRYYLNAAGISDGSSSGRGIAFHRGNDADATGRGKQEDQRVTQNMIATFNAMGMPDAQEFVMRAGVDRLYRISAATALASHVATDLTRPTTLTAVQTPTAAPIGSDDDDWSIARAANSYDDYHIYVKIHPRGRHVEDARRAALALALQNEPNIGTVPPGKIVLVDDHSCPSGEIKIVTGGDQTSNISRTRGCVPLDQVP